jgi:hypothetical protein
MNFMTLLNGMCVQGNTAVTEEGATVAPECAEPDAKPLSCSKAEVLRQDNDLEDDDASLKTIKVMLITPFAGLFRSQLVGLLKTTIPNTTDRFISGVKSQCETA